MKDYLMYRIKINVCILPLLQLLMISQIHVNKMDDSLSRVSVTEGPHKVGDDLKHVQENVQSMRNRIQLLHHQLQKQKDSIQKHKSLTNNVVKQKIEINKQNIVKSREAMLLEEQILNLKNRNYSYRQMHKKQMTNILKAVYLVKLDDARQIKNASMQNRRSLEKVNQSDYERKRQRKRSIIEQSEMAKQKYLQYWKSKLNSIYTEGQKNSQECLMQAENKKRQLQNLKQEQLRLLQSINELHQRQTEAKKQYMAALSLSHRDVADAALQNEVEAKKSMQKHKSSLQLSNRSESNRYKQTDFFTKTPYVSVMTSNNIMIPRANVDQGKFQIILRQLRRLQQKEKAETQ